LEINCRKGASLLVSLAPGHWQLSITDANGQPGGTIVTHVIRTNADRIPLTLQTGQKARFAKQVGIVE